MPTISTLYTLDSHRLQAQWLLPVCSLPAAHAHYPPPACLIPTPCTVCALAICRLHTHYPPLMHSLSATHALAIRCLRACYPPHLCPQYPLHMRLMAVPHVLNGRCPYICYPPPCALDPRPCALVTLVAGAPCSIYAASSPAWALNTHPMHARWPPPVCSLPIDKPAIGP
ncbi:hypothetical protein B0H14DRAFT_3477081 [Mycena olivaceomarginata]|nr:hypothetical protein B0H14DRAFT_3477081 [Mycena olivaceomarginata]